MGAWGLMNVIIGYYWVSGCMGFRGLGSNWWLGVATGFRGLGF